MKQQTLEEVAKQFIESLQGQNKSRHTIGAYETDLRQFMVWLHSQSINKNRPDQVSRIDINEFLSYMARQGSTGKTRARKLTSIREFFKFALDQQLIEFSPAAAIKSPKKEQKTRSFLRPDEYNKLLAQAGANPRDFAILQLFLQTGIRVEELTTLTLDSINLEARTITINGKGKKQRVLDLEKKATQAMRSYLKIRASSSDPHIFLSYEGTGISIRGVQKLVKKYATLAGITRPVSCHILRHTFGTMKAAQGVSAFQLKEWFGHEDITTSQQYVHLAETNSNRIKQLMEATSL
jgi:integrase/recombinase XerD